MNLNFTLILQIISFIILMFLLSKFLYKPLLDMLDKRSRQIHQEIESAKKSEEQSRRYAEQTHAALQMAKEEAIKIKEQARRDSDTSKRETLSQAKKEYIEIIDRAKKDIEQEIKSAKLRLQSDTAGLAVEIAGKILQKEIKKEDHEKFIKQFIEDFKNGRS